jgi:hypothetical protein
MELLVHALQVYLLVWFVIPLLLRLGLYIESEVLAVWDYLCEPDEHELASREFYY